MDEVRAQAMLQELEQHANFGRTRSAQLAAELAVSNQKVDALTKEVEALRPKEEVNN